MSSYNIDQIMSDVQASRQSGLHKELNTLREENETLKLEHSMAKRKLSIYEKKEKERLNNLKKGREVRVKNAASKRRDDQKKNSSVGKSHKTASRKR